jgi:hypothetical protein
LGGDKTNAENDDKMMVSKNGGGDGGGAWDRRRKNVWELTWENGGPGVWAPDYHATRSATSSIPNCKSMPIPGTLWKEHFDV